MSDVEQLRRLEQRSVMRLRHPIQNSYEDWNNGQSCDLYVRRGTLVKSLLYTYLHLFQESETHSEEWSTMTTRDDHGSLWLKKQHDQFSIVLPLERYFGMQGILKYCTANREELSLD